MDSFISTVIFTLPGLMCYYWLQLFGINPIQKHNPFEMLGISALLWLPVSGLALLIIDFFAFMENLYFGQTNGNVIPFVSSISTLNTALGDLKFIFLFIIFSLFFSYVVSRFYAEILFGKILEHVNCIRVEKLKLGKLSSKPTVWEEVISNIDPKVVKISKVDKPEEFIIGSIVKASRPLDLERNVVLEEVDFFTQLVEKYNPSIMRTFIDAKSGVIIYIYSPEVIEFLQNLDVYTPQPIVTVPFLDPLSESEKEQE